MKTKTNLLGILIPIALLLISSLISSGCGSADPYYENVKQYEAGEWKPGWWYDGMSDDEVKKHIDGMIDTEARKMALEFCKNKYTFVSEEKNEPTALPLGTVAVSNEIGKTIKAGADWIGPNDLEKLTASEKKKLENDQKSGLLDYNWTVGKKSVIYPQLMPGRYYTWYKWNGQKKYTLNEKKEKEILIIGLQPSWFIDQYVSGVILIQR